MADKVKYKSSNNEDRKSRAVCDLCCAIDQINCHPDQVGRKSITPGGTLALFGSAFIMEKEELLKLPHCHRSSATVHKFLVPSELPDHVSQSKRLPLMPLCLSLRYN
ncbi:hypothetical protein KIN20_032195 [Parelaphostrongylus tenuis]|uniref:Uncharacterized protein n=1 Tax=Parelaphostrongylus tenuis TaxID=148309 RepID=A0AAD5R6W1_PARTN|nr:hypothetical protein KIN20_032195 [Parelaphostrongylus tenuis]